ncbi:MAG: response regulator transcription factor [Patescibacteria group bacterium]
MRILVVDDDRGISSFLKKALKNEGFEVDVASDGKRGSFLARTNEYDLIVLDNVLPEKSGSQVCAEVRGDGKTVPILMLSVKDNPGVKADLLDTGADDYLAKPFSFKELLARVRALLRRPHRTESEVIKVGDLVLDEKRYLVKYGPEEICLTPKEFALLGYLMRHQDEIVTRGAIIEHVWDMNADLLSNSIEAHVSNLRRKIASSGRPNFIRTIPSRGYMVTAKNQPH